MIELSKIWANARYEMTILLRGWFFRIFAGISIALFIFLNIIFFSTAVPTPRVFKGFSASIPYSNMIMLNLAQIAVIIFMAGDFFKRDKNLNTSQVYYIRSMTNSTYIMGKVAGILLLFMAFNLIIFAIAALIHTFFSETPVNYFAYIFYPLMQGLPSLIFMIGLSFLLMRIINNQAIVALLLLGYFALTLFYLSGRYDFIFDFVALQLPMAISDFIGVANKQLVLLQRGFYLFTGITLILLAMVFFTRLPQSRLTRTTAVIAAVIFGVASVYCAASYITIHENNRELRTQVREIDQKYVERANIKPTFCAIDLIHSGDKITATSRIKFTNSNPGPLDRIYFTLNPELSVTSIKMPGREIDFHREAHIIDIPVTPALPAGMTDSIEINYSGRITDAIAYSDIDEEIRAGTFSIWMYQLAKNHAFLEPDHVLLNSETIWYPTASLLPGSGYPEKTYRHFIDYRLSVKTRKDLVAVSQGESDNPEPGVFHFRPEFPLDKISLAIAPYVLESISIDSTDFQIFRLPEHDYYKSYFSELGDTLANVLHELKDDYEVRLGMEYPFKRLALVEVPIQYFCYPRHWTTTEDISQPEQIWIQENVGGLTNSDFKAMRDRMDRRMDRSNQTFSELETQINILKTFFNQTFLGKSEARFRFGDRLVEFNPDYNIFPNYYSHVSFIDAPDRQIFNTAMEAYLFERVKPAGDNTPVWIQEGLTDNETVSQALLDSSLAELLSAPNKNSHLADVIKQKGSYFFKLMQNQFNADGFDEKINSILTRYRFEPLPLDEFITGITPENLFDFDTAMEQWYNGKQLPAYYVSNPVLYKVLDGDRIRSQVVFSINNTENISGLFEVLFEYSRRGRGMPFGQGGDEEPARLFMTQPGQSIEVGILLDEEPRELNINFLIARNIPLVYSKHFEDAELKKGALPFDGVRPAPGPINLSAPDEIIVDNEDEHFEIYNPPFTSSLKRLIHGDDQTSEKHVYDRFQWWRPPSRWTLIKNPAFYGDYIHSAYYLASGSGDRYVTWKTEITDPGLYDVYIYLFDKEGFWRGRQGRRNVTYGEYNYLVRHEGGVEKTMIDTGKAPEGWNFLGTWFLNAGEATISLTDESNGSIIIADAVKWVKN